MKGHAVKPMQQHLTRVPVLPTKIPAVPTGVIFATQHNSRVYQQPAKKPAVRHPILVLVHKTSSQTVMVMLTLVVIQLIETLCLSNVPAPVAILTVPERRMQTRVVLDGRLLVTVMVNSFPACLMYASKAVATNVSSEMNPSFSSEALCLSPEVEGQHRPGCKNTFCCIFRYL